MSSRENPPGAEDGAATHVLVEDLNTHLPRELTLLGLHPPNDPGVTGAALELGSLATSCCGVRREDSRREELPQHPRGQQGGKEGLDLDVPVPSLF